jgi:hypothetical protein
MLEGKGSYGIVYSCPRLPFDIKFFFIINTNILEISTLRNTCPNEDLVDLSIDIEEHPLESPNFCQIIRSFVAPTTCDKSAKPRRDCSYVDPLDLPKVVGATKERMIPSESAVSTSDKPTLQPVRVFRKSFQPFSDAWNLRKSPLEITDKLPNSTRQTLLEITGVFRKLKQPSISQADTNSKQALVETAELITDQNIYLEVSKVFFDEHDYKIEYKNYIKIINIYKVNPNYFNFPLNYGTINKLEISRNTNIYNKIWSCNNDKYLECDNHITFKKGIKIFKNNNYIDFLTKNLNILDAIKYLNENCLLFDDFKADNILEIENIFKISDFNSLIKFNEITYDVYMSSEENFSGSNLTRFSISDESSDNSDPLDLSKKEMIQPTSMMNCYTQSSIINNSQSPTTFNKSIGSEFEIGQDTGKPKGSKYQSPPRILCNLNCIFYYIYSPILNKLVYYYLCEEKNLEVSFNDIINDILKCYQNIDYISYLDYLSQIIIFLKMHCSNGIIKSCINPKLFSQSGLENTSSRPSELYVNLDCYKKKNNSYIKCNISISIKEILNNLFFYVDIPDENKKILYYNVFLKVLHDYLEIICEKNMNKIINNLFERINIYSLGMLFINILSKKLHDLYLNKDFFRDLFEIIAMCCLTSFDIKNIIYVNQPDINLIIQKYKELILKKYCNY